MQEINEQKLMELIKKTNTIHPLDDYGFGKVRDEMLYYSGHDETKFIAFLNTLTTDDIVDISPIFEDIAERFKKRKSFKNAIVELEKSTTVIWIRSFADIKMKSTLLNAGCNFYT